MITASRSGGRGLEMRIKPYPSTTGSILLALALLVLLTGVALLLLISPVYLGFTVAIAGFLLIQLVNFRYAERDRGSQPCASLADLELRTDEGDRRRTS